jgi:hypothetical protein
MPKTNLIKALKEVEEDTDLFGPEGACPTLIERSSSPTRYLLISGENAGGKSFVTRYLSMIFRSDVPEFRTVDIGMKRRTTQDISRAFIYGGDEGERSTGTLSVQAFTGSLRNTREWDSPHMIVLDEPDLGLSEGYQTAMGEFLAREAGTITPKCMAVVLVTHSREIARHFMTLNPHMMRIGDDLRPTRQWLDEGPLPRSAEDLKKLMDTGINRLRAISRIMDARKEERRAAEEKKREKEKAARAKAKPDKAERAASRARKP